MKIGKLKLDSPILLAPMAGISSLPYRRLMKEFGAALVYSEMVSANGLIRDGKRTLALVDSCPEERPFGIQLFGDDPQVLAEAAGILGSSGDVIDLNCGCPVNKVVRSGAGSALLKHPRKIGQIVASIRRVSDQPLTIKIRSGWDRPSQNFLEVGRIAEESGVDAVILHPRTRSQGFGGQADWDQIGELKNALGIPVIGSGDITSPADAERMLAATGCDGVMIGRGAFGNPWLLENIRRRLAGMVERVPSPRERLEVILHHFVYHEETFGEKITTFEMRKHLSWYSRGLPAATAFRQTVNRSSNMEEIRRLTRDYFSAIDEQAVANG